MGLSQIHACIERLLDESLLIIGSGPGRARRQWTPPSVLFAC